MKLRTLNAPLDACGEELDPSAVYIALEPFSTLVDENVPEHSEIVVKGTRRKGSDPVVERTLIFWHKDDGRRPPPPLHLRDR